MTTLESFQNWYLSQCNGDWEHGEGIRLTTLDNPGWGMDINLTDTALMGKPFQPIRKERSKDDWVFCFIEDNRFKIRCGPLNLETGIETFLKWADSYP